MLECGFAEFLYWGLPLSFKAQCLPQIKKWLCLAGCHVVAQTQGYHVVCICGSLGKFQGGGSLLRLCFVLECRFAEFLHRGLPLSFKAQCLPQIKGGFCLAGCHVVAQAQGYHVVCIWGSLVKFKGGGVVVKFDVFWNSYAVCLCCLHASNDPLC